MSDERYYPGQHVAWTSQSAGTVKHKSGVVIAVVPAGEHPSRYLPRHCRLAGGGGFGSPRNHESYIVDVAGVAYWPRVSQLVCCE